jgi:hypothetical protein
MMDKRDPYKNLEFASKAYSVAEGAFPLWEAVFALIVGQILIAYFSSHLHIDQKIGLAFLGLILSIIWFFLVSLNFLNAYYITGKMEKIHECLKTCDASMPFISTPFIWPWPNKDEKGKWTWRVILTGQLPGQKQATRHELLTSTWLCRRALPGVMIVTWLLLISWQIWLVFFIKHRWH